MSPTLPIEQLDCARTALVFIEFQAAWMGKDAKLQHLLVKDKVLFQQAIDNASDLIEAARGVPIRIVHAGLDLQHDKSYQIFAQGNDKWGLRGAIPKAGTWTGADAEFVPPFTPKAGEFVVAGRSGASVIMGSNLDAFCRNNDINTLVLLGFALHVCVESTLRAAHDLGYNVLVVDDACGVFEKSQQDYFNQHVIHHFGKRMGTQAFINLLKASK